MENQGSCPIREALLRVEASAKNSRDLGNIFYFLQRIISNLLTHPNDWKNRSLDKENGISGGRFLSLREVQYFLKLLGFSEDGRHVRSLTDEDMKFLEAVLKILNAHIYNLKIALADEKPYFQESRSSRSPRGIMNHADPQCEKIMESKSRCAKLKDILSRHLKQDRLESGTVCSWRKSDSSDSSFNSDGYFYQTSNQKKDIKKRKCLYERMLDRHDFNNDQKGQAFFHF